MPKKYDRPGCCAEGSGLIDWREANRKRSALGIEFGPRRDGWCMSVDDMHIVNVKYCPFCGVKLPPPVAGAEW